MHPFTKHRTAIVILTLLLAAILAACSDDPLPSGGNEIPTPRAGERVGETTESQATSNPEDTFERYIRDSIAAQVENQRDKIDIRQRYENPDITVQNLGGLLTEISVLEDRTEISLPNDRTANANVDMDIRILYADGDTESRTCRYAVNMQQAANSVGDPVWYIINPDAFPVFFSCTVS